MTGLVEMLDWLHGDGHSLFWGGVLVFVRLGALCALLPVFGEYSLPQRIKLAAALGLTVLIAPMVTTPQTITPAAIVIEAMIGLMLGVGFRLVFLGLNMAGVFVSQSTSLAQIMGGAQAEPQPSFANLMALAGLSLAFTLGFHVLLVRFLLESYQLLPQGRLPGAGDATDWGVAQISRSFGLALSLAAPFVIGALLYNIALGLINRAMPLLPVAFIGAPALTLLALAAMAICAPLMLDIWRQSLLQWLASPLAARP